jgi:hypothetical protein
MPLEIPASRIKINGHKAMVATNEDTENSLSLLAVCEKGPS